MQVKVKELNLGDVVQLGCDVVQLGCGGEYSTATVNEKFENGDVMIWRPYIHSDDFSYGGNGSSRVITTIGLETLRLYAEGVTTLLRKGRELK